MASAKSVDSSLWWDPFTSLLTDLENSSLFSEPPQRLVEKMKANHAWFVETVSMFKAPNQKSREALKSERVKLGTHELVIQPDLRDKAITVSSYMDLDEVQSYILVERSLEHGHAAFDSADQEFIHVILLQYSIERQCLLKCTRRILTHALYIGTGLNEGSIIGEEALKLVSDGLERKQIFVLEELLSSSSPELMDVDLFTLWAEERLTEDTLILDILFLIYYESFCTCNGERWRKLCSLYKGILSGSYNFGKLAVSKEARHSSFYVKIQLLLILIETLDLEGLLQMVHDEVAFRSGASVFLLTDIQEMDAIVSSFAAFEFEEVKEAGPLILTWAVFLCLVSSLPGREENSFLMDIDHVGYVNQAFEAASLSYFLEILQSDLLQESDGPVAGYRSVLRTFISAFIASYEINLQLEDTTLNLMLEILCKVYEGEESLCVQFWDRESFVDGPVRCLLHNLAGEFPFRTGELIRLLSSLCEGSWPAECVYNFLDKSIGISTLFEVSSDSLLNKTSQVVETQLPLPVPGFEGLVIPIKTRGHVLKVVCENTALVRWEYAQSAVTVLLLRLSNSLFIDNHEEVHMILNLLSRMVSFNKAICFALLDIKNFLHVREYGVDRRLESNVRVVEIICSVIRSSIANPVGAAVMSVGLNILAKMLRCSPSYVADVALKANIFDMASATNVFNIGYGASSSGSWLLSGKVAKMILIDCEKNENELPLVISVLDFTLQLVQTGFENDAVLTLVVFSLQYILPSHEYWKYKDGHIRWRVTQKVLEVVKACITSISFSKKLGDVIRSIILNDSSIHVSLFRVVCTTTQTLEKLCVSRFIELPDIEGWQLAIASVLDILDMLLRKFQEDSSSSLPVLLQAMLSSRTRPIPVVVAVSSLISYFHYPRIQIGAAKVLSLLLALANSSELYVVGNSCFGLDNKQITDLKHSVSRVILEHSSWNEDLLIAIIDLLISAACYQPAFLLEILASKDNTENQLINPEDGKLRTEKSSLGAKGINKSDMIDAILQCVENSDDLFNSNPRVLLGILILLKTLWQGAGLYADLLESLTISERFWKQLSNFVSETAILKNSPQQNMSSKKSLKLALRFRCEASTLEIMACEIFLKNKVLYAESLAKQTIQSTDRIENAIKYEKSRAATQSDPKDVLLQWCNNNVLSSMIEAYTSYQNEHNIHFRVQVATSLLTVHLIVKLASSGAGVLSASLVEKIQLISKELTSQTAFSELLAQYSRQGYSEGEELKKLILSDLYYHLQGELEGRSIAPGPFNELFQFLSESSFWQTIKQKYDGDFHATAKDIYVYDTGYISTVLNVDMWEYSEWRESKTAADTMLNNMQMANGLVVQSCSRLSALKALSSVLTVYEDISLDGRAIGRKVPSQLSLSWIGEICQHFHVAVESLAHARDASEDMLDFLVAQVELLFHLTRSASTNLSIPVCALLLRTSGSSLKMLSDFRPSVPKVKEVIKLSLQLLLLTLGFGSHKSNSMAMKDTNSHEGFADISNISLGLLPILCNLITDTEYSSVAPTALDLILRNFLTPETWLPIILKHLQLQQLLWKLHDWTSVAFFPTIMKFFLTLARTRGGAEMLLYYGFFSSLRALFTDLADVELSSGFNNENGSWSETNEKPQQVWGLGLAVLTAIINSIGDKSSCVEIVENILSYFFSEKAYLISYYLRAPDFPSSDQNKKRARMQQTWTSLTYLKETEHTLVLMCSVASHWNSWVKVVKELDSPLRETSIHLLAFISRGAQRLRESQSRTAPLICPPVHKEEFDQYNKPSSINSNHGWFSLAPVCCVPKPKFPTVSSSTALIVKAQAADMPEGVSPSHFSDSVAVQIYRIAFLLLKFLCLQAEGAAKRAEESGFVDLATFPELPMPEILHGLQDQVIPIITELCEKGDKKEVPSGIQEVCILLFQIMDMALYLELCVLQVCGIRPVLGRVDGLSKQVKLLIKAVEGHSFLKSSLESLKQMVSVIYPGLR